MGGLTEAGRDIPDPWGGGPDEFGHVLDLLRAAAPVIVARLARLLEPMTPVTLSAARRIARQTGLAIREARVAGSQHGYQHLMLALAGGQRAFAKVAAAQDDGPGRAGRRVRGRGQRPALAGRGGRRPGARGAGRHRDRAGHLDAPAGSASPSAAFRFGTELARMHAAGAADFGAPWRGFIASLPLDNTPGRGRLAAVVRPPQAAALPQDGGGLQRAAAGDERLVEAVIDRIDSLAGPAEPPSRIHGDCWAGNVLWSGDRGWLIDPAAHGGHRETDLAMLDLFGAPHLDRILAGYNDTAPLAAGWRSRIPLHQLHPLLVHACLFGSSYREGVLSAARSALSV